MPKANLLGKETYGQERLARLGPVLCKVRFGFEPFYFGCIFNTDHRADLRKALEEDL